MVGGQPRTREADAFAAAADRGIPSARAENKIAAKSRYFYF